MQSLTLERSSNPTTIRARISAPRSTGVPPVPGRQTLPPGDRPLPAKISLAAKHGQDARATSAPRIVVTLDAALSEGAGLARIPIAVTGKWVRDGSEFQITLDDLKDILNNFQKRRNGEINVDYDHASEMPEVAAGGPVPSAGRIVRLDAPENIDSLNHWAIDPLKKPRSSNGSLNQSTNGSILWGWYEPTPRARKLIESREYRYISPAINWAGRDKTTGKLTGTTLTSVALTNRPFLEELPQIRLSDPAYQFVDVGDVHVETSLGVGDGQEKIDSLPHFSIDPLKVKRTDSSNGSMNQSVNGSVSSNGSMNQSNNESILENGGVMKQVNLSVQDGKVKVAHPDFAEEYFADPAEMKQCLSDLGGEEAGDDDLAATVQELAGLDGDGNGAPDVGGAGREGSVTPRPAATLAECVAEIRRKLSARGEISLREATALLSENEAGGKAIPAAEFFRWRVEQELDEAVKTGKVLPRQRDDWRKVALSDFPTFRKIVAEQKTQVPLRPVGLSGPGPEDAPTQVKLLAEQRMRERKISFGQALSEIGREQPDLAHQYRRSVSA